ncbi:hypothetical protein C8R47DRAFT_1076418 [Mycena vitilis]|nr:hypothetical protein C8R47DRAFT_1076418 [Mycena vitilis]
MKTASPLVMTSFGQTYDIKFGGAIKAAAPRFELFRALRTEKSCNELQRQRSGEVVGLPVSREWEDNDRRDRKREDYTISTKEMSHTFFVISEAPGIISASTQPQAAPKWQKIVYHENPWEVAIDCRGFDDRHRCRSTQSGITQVQSAHNSVEGFYMVLLGAFSHVIDLGLAQTPAHDPCLRHGGSLRSLRPYGGPQLVGAAPQTPVDSEFPALLRARCARAISRGNRGNISTSGSDICATARDLVRTSSACAVRPHPFGFPKHHFEFPQAPSASAWAELYRKIWVFCSQDFECRALCPPSASIASSRTSSTVPSLLWNEVVEITDLSTGFLKKELLANTSDALPKLSTTPQTGAPNLIALAGWIERAALLEWWSERLFPESHQATTVGETHNFAPSIAERMAVQTAATHVQAELAATDKRRRFGLGSQGVVQPLHV